MRTENRTLAAVTCVCLTLALPAICRAATLTVTNTSDSGVAADGSLRGEIAAANPGDGSLRGEIASANPGDTIQFSVTGTISLTSPLTISKSLTIDGTSARGPITIVGGNSLQIMVVGSGTNVKVQNLTLSHGHSTTSGGAILNQGMLTIINSTFTDNHVTGGPGLDGTGGAIFNNDDLTFTNCTFSGNTATGGPSSTAQARSGDGLGGAIFSNNALSATNSTFSGNTATGGDGSGAISGGSGAGGAIENDGTGTMHLTNVTFAGNQAMGGANGGTAHGGAIFQDSSLAVTLQGTLLATSTPDNCEGSPFVDNGFNISDDLSCGFGTSMGANGQTIGDSIANPGLDPAGLANNGGPTETIALLSTSVAINAIPLAACPTTDQRTFPRPGITAPVPACDIGAYELQAPPPPTPVAATIESYFDVATAFTPSGGGYGGQGNSGGSGDAVLRVVDAGNWEADSAHGRVCANIYVFNDVQEEQECCACPLTADSLMTFSVINNLTSNPLNQQESLSAGVIKIVGTNLVATASCANTPGAVTAAFSNPLAAGLHAWISRTETMASNQPGFKPPFGFVTSTSVEGLAPADLDSGELVNLRAECAAINAADHTGSQSIGICKCGLGD
jgi:hypothetical protein